ncbi:diguanylate cyclase (GGDEF)-like protein [Nitrobacteraceae bacterium AZCC 1564]
MIVIDYNSMLVALSFCSAGLTFTFFVSWLVSRSDRVLMTWAIGALLIVISLLIYSEFVRQFSPPVGVLAFGTLLSGLTFLLGASYQFRTGVLPLGTMAVVAAVTAAAMAVPMLQGYDGVSYIVFNFGSAAILFYTSWDYWRWRAESPLLIITLSGLYSLTALSFVLCGVVLIHDQSWVMGHAPDGWVENINLGVSLASIASMGALSLGLNQVRDARRHKRNAETDVLTGLSNRRAFLDRTQNLPAPVAAIVFDIDHFKPVNDRHGHEIGDVVLQRFGALLEASIRDGDIAARLGGEEFAVILPGATVAAATVVAERMRQSFAEWRFQSPTGPFTSTVSAGISYGVDGKPDLAGLLREADAALYDAKRSGRNRVVVYSAKTGLDANGKPSAEVVQLRA